MSAVPVPPSRIEAQPTPPAAVNTARAAAILGVSPSWLNQRRVFGDGGPSFFRCGSRVLYSVADLHIYVGTQKRCTSTAEYLIGGAKCPL
jgi:hypothetical protein